MQVPVIDLLFPKPVMCVDGVNLEHIESFKNKINQIFDTHGSKRLEILDVDSIHKTYPNLHKDPEFKPLVESIHILKNIFMKEMGYDQKYIDSIQIVTMWSNKSKVGDFLESHIHQNCLFSGAYYIDAPEDSKIFFHDYTNMHPVPEITTKLSDTYRWYQCKIGRLIMFKNDLPHSTNKQTSDDRMVISFNLKQG